MGKNDNTIPFFRKDKTLIASYNKFYKILYLSKTITKEELEDVKKKLTKKHYNNYEIMES